MILTKLDSDSSFDLTAEKLIEYQKIDMDLNFLISWKEKGEKPVWETVSPCSLAVKYHWSRWDTLYLKAGMLYRKWENADGHGEKWLVVLPQTLIKFVLIQLHNSVTGGHLGIKKDSFQSQGKIFLV